MLKIQLPKFLWGTNITQVVQRAYQDRKTFWATGITIGKYGILFVKIK